MSSTTLEDLRQSRKRQRACLFSDLYQSVSLFPPNIQEDLKSRFSKTQHELIEQDDLLSVADSVVDSTATTIPTVSTEQVGVAMPVIIQTLSNLLEIGVDGPYDGLKLLRLVDRSSHSMASTCTSRLGLASIKRGQIPFNPNQTHPTRSQCVTNELRLRWRLANPHKNVPYASLSVGELRRLRSLMYANDAIAKGELSNAKTLIGLAEGLNKILPIF